MKRNAIALLSAVAVVSLLALAPPASAAVSALTANSASPNSTSSGVRPATFGWCDGHSPAGVTDAITLYPVAVSGALTVELRYSPSQRCAWGRVTGQVGSEIWTDRSYNGG